MKPRILIVFGTRPEVIKLAPLIKALKESQLKDQLVLISTTQHESLLDEQLDYWGIAPDYFLETPPHKSSLTRLLAHSISGIQDIIDQLGSAEYMIVQGDTNTALACANIAFLNKIRLVHIEAGLRSFDMESPFPEEFNRVVASRAAYFHFAPTEISEANLINEGINPADIMVVGNTVIDAMCMASQRVTQRPDRSLVLITLHRRENIDGNYRILISLVRNLAVEYPELKFVWVTHPNCSEQVKAELPETTNIELHEHLPYSEFIAMYASCCFVITDSGGVSEEAVHSGLPVIIFRKTTERIEAIREHYPMLVSLDKHEITAFFRDSVYHANKVSYSYGDGQASQRILKWLIQNVGQPDYDIAIVGGGPAGTGLLMKAIKDEHYRSILHRRIAVIESSDKLIRGSITNYHVNSDTLSDVFLECLQGTTGEFIATDELENEVAQIRSYRGRSIPLTELENYYIKLGGMLKTSLAKCDFIVNRTVSHIIQRKDASYELNFEDGSNPLTARSIVLATGGSPCAIRGDIKFNDEIPLAQFLHKSVHSDVILKGGFEKELFQLKQRHGKVLILGGGHSAFSVAHYLLQSEFGADFGSGDIAIWSKSHPKIYFDSKEEAMACSYSEFTDDDICPLTGRLYRLAGLRMDGRELYMRMIGMGTNEVESRVTLSVYDSGKREEMFKELNDAALIILAFGYEFNIIPIMDKNGNPLKFAGQHTSHWVNDNCELLDENGDVIPNVYASGLATGFIPRGDLGGEPSFSGQTNGLWYYQNVMAGRIIEGICREYFASLS